MRAERLAPDESIAIDGAPDESAWQRATAAVSFVQREPATGDPATERTEVRVALRREPIDSRRHASTTASPTAMLSNQMQRDESFDADDSFAWIVDTFLDGRTGYFFEINRCRARWATDSSRRRAAAGAVGRWRWWWRRWRRWRWRGHQPIVGRHLARARPPHGDRMDRRDRDSVPTLNFNPNLNEWGINFRRTVRRKNEESLWSGHALNQGLTRARQCGPRRGIPRALAGRRPRFQAVRRRPRVVGARPRPAGRAKATATSASTRSTTSRRRFG